MITVNDSDPFIEYAGENSVLIVPITQHVRKDGCLVFVDDLTKSLHESYKTLSKKWGYMIQNGVSYPYFIKENVSLIGVPEKSHYASAFNEELFMEGMWYIREKAFLEPQKTFYIKLKVEYDLDKIKDVFKYSDNLVLLN